MLSKDNIPLPFPILIDADHQVSSGLGLFTTSWGGSEVAQNIPAVYLIDEQGILRFKYISQNNLDRPEYDYLLKILDLIKQKKRESLFIKRSADGIIGFSDFVDNIQINIMENNL